MESYSEFRPTALDSAGLSLPDRQNWLVLPVSQTRDSGPLSQSNFDTALELLGGEGDTVEVHRFSHWGPGWFEVIIVDPDSDKAAIAESIEARLESYPVLDEEDFSRREYDDYLDGWNSYGARDFIRKLETDYDLGQSAVDFLEDCDMDDLRQLFEAGVPSGEYFIEESSGIAIMLRAFGMSRTDLGRWIKQQRNTVNC